MRKKNVTVYCGASFGNDERYQEVTKKLGEWIGKNNYNLVYGGGKSGLMGLILILFLKMEERLQEL